MARHTIHGDRVIKMHFQVCIRAGVSGTDAEPGKQQLSSDLIEYVLLPVSYVFYLTVLSLFDIYSSYIP